MKQPLRALLLAAGLGTRLRPITLKTPKCLVSVAGEPLLGRWLRKLEEVGCEEVLINTHYMANQVNKFLSQYTSSKLNIKTFHEPTLLGTAGTLMANLDFFHNSTGLLIHADNVMEENLEQLIFLHKNRPSNCLLTMLTFLTDQPDMCGIVTTDHQGIVTSFHEKVQDPPGNCANGALYIFDTSFLSYLNELAIKPTDFSTDVIPSLMGRIQTYSTDKAYIDIGTPSALEKAQLLEF